MGIIYRITFPNGKCYVGQTTAKFNKRLAGHKTAVNIPKYGNSLFYRAVRKYGWDKCIKEIIFECPDEELNDKEKFFIQEHRALKPDGYNTLIGGSHIPKIKKERKPVKHDEEFKPIVLILEDMEDKFTMETTFNKKRNNKSTGLPKYISYWKSPDDKEGHRIKRHPKCRCKTFMDKSKTLEQNKQDAIAFLDKLNKGEVEVVIPERKLPKGLHQLKEGYRVVYWDKSGKRHVRQFLDLSVEIATRKEQALKYINELMEKDINSETPRISADKTA
jgi:hypothetical protein